MTPRVTTDPVARHIAHARPGQLINARGTIVSAAITDIGGVASYRVTIRESHAEIDAIFAGRLVRGFTSGLGCTITGRVTERSGRLVIWNPQYRLTLADAVTGTLPDPAADRHPPILRPWPTASRRSHTGCEPTPPQPSSPAVSTAETPVEPTGRFRIYLGLAAGVGKTYAMLSEAHRRGDRGSDVVAAVVHTHGRPATAAQLAGLDTIPLATVAYRGTTFTEMDVDAVIARRPEVALVDELAHTNVPGSGRHEKRWQDVLELLDANINVITTVNIQHVESLADVVERITGVPVRERVPDEVLRRADQIELVDSSPEQLRRRMLHGNIYPPDRAATALTGFFRADTLAALRELTLRFLADEIDDELIDRLTGADATGWEISERILVGVTPTPGADGVLRRASRIASRIKAELHAVHVHAAETSPRNADALAELHALADQLGASWHELDGDPAQAIMRVAQEHHITQIVIGRSRHSRWGRLTAGGSTVRRLTRRTMSAAIDLHIVTRDPAGTRLDSRGH